MAQEMVKMAQEITMKEAPEEALGMVLKTYLEQKIAECQEAIKRFEEKYGVNITDFYEKLDEEFSLSWEHERDYMDWDWATAKLKNLKEKLGKLQIHED